MDYSKKTLAELKELWKASGLKGYSTKSKAELINGLLPPAEAAPSPPQNTVVTHPVSKNVLSLFSGAGGDTCGLEQAGWKVRHFSEFNTSAIQTHLAAFPESTLLKGSDGSNDIKAVPDETFVSLRGSVDLIFAGFPCFVAGTLVLTQRGYVPIETVTLDDQLMTHTGAFQGILNLQQKRVPASTTLHSMRVKYHPQELVGTSEHPFYVRTRQRTWDVTARKYTYAFKAPEWKPFRALTKDDFCGMTINSNSVVPTHTVTVRKNAHRVDTLKITLDSKDQWFTLGYFVGDGWIEETDHKIRFSILESDTHVLKRIQTVLPITDKCVRSGPCLKYGCSSAAWFQIFEQFGRHGKMIPEWVQDAPVEFVQEFLAGYAAADGCVKKNGVLRLGTVSPNLAFGVQRLYLKLGHIASVQKTARKPTCAQRDTYEIDVRFKKTKQPSAFVEDGYAWMAPFKLSQHATTAQQTVYNFEVETDNSYIVENTVVHNCQGFSHAGKKRTDDPRNELVHQFVRAVKQIQPT